MKPLAYITTSWDDGNPLDLRIADLLTKYGLRGTFYVPKKCEYGTMSEGQLRELSSTFEIGAHTVNHVFLNEATEQVARSEIADSKSWVEGNTGAACRIFCPPKGQYSRRHLDLIRNAGFSSVRTTELLSLAFPRSKAGLFVMPTTLQAHPHTLGAYVRNTMRRAAFANLWRYASHRGSADWVKLARSLVCKTIEHGGVFHLWGHSWEIEQTGQWHALEEVLKFVSRSTDKAQRLTNQQVCETCALKHDKIEHRNANADLLTACR